MTEYDAYMAGYWHGLDYRPEVLIAIASDQRLAAAYVKGACE